MAPSAPGQRCDPDAVRGASTCFGRLGLRGYLRAPEALAARLAGEFAPGAKVAVLGTGEFMHAAMLLGEALARHGVDVRVQSTTRSPILTWGAVSTALAFPDNYGEGIPNFLYNVAARQYDHVLVCHETPATDSLRAFARGLEARLFHFHTEDHVEEVPVR